jgi:hypothetical protein
MFLSGSVLCASVFPVAAEATMIGSPAAFSVSLS